MKPFPDPGFLILPYHDMFVFFLVFDGPFISNKKHFTAESLLLKANQGF